MTTWKDALQRRDDVREAFLEGCQAAYLGNDETFDPEKAWEVSEARKKLQEPLK